MDFHLTLVYPDMCGILAPSGMFRGNYPVHVKVRRHCASVDHVVEDRSPL